MEPFLKSESGPEGFGAGADTYPLFEQLCDLLLVLLQVIFDLGETSQGELLPVVRTELAQLGLGPACRSTQGGGEGTMVTRWSLVAN